MTKRESALAQPEQEFVCSTGLCHYKAQPEQEPVIDKSAAVRIATALGWEPQRTWVGLTDEEREIASWTDGSFGAGARWAEAKLKEKNT